MTKKEEIRFIISGDDTSIKIGICDILIALEKRFDFIAKICRHCATSNMLSSQVLTTDTYDEEEKHTRGKLWDIYNDELEFQSETTINFIHSLLTPPEPKQE